MNWEETLKLHNLEALRRQIKGKSDLWSSFDNTDAMNEFLDGVLQTGNTRDVAFKRDCIAFVKDVFPPSSDSIRSCILASPIMKGVYDLLCDGRVSAGFEKIIEHSNHILEWNDLRSGIALFSTGELSREAFGALAEVVTEKELADFFISGLMTEEILDTLLHQRGKWESWGWAAPIIRRYPKSLRHICFIDIASKQTDDIIYDISTIPGIDKQVIRKVVLMKGIIRNWDYALDYLAQDILLSSDAAFKKIAKRQSCEELFNLYEGEFIEGKDLKDIIEAKGYWDHLASVEQLRQDDVLGLSEEQIILYSINKGKQLATIIDALFKDLDLLQRVIITWENDNSSCPNFPSLLWESLLGTIVNEQSVKFHPLQDYCSLATEVASIDDELLLQLYLIKQYIHKGEDFITGFIRALENGKLISESFRADYHVLSQAHSYLPLDDLAEFKHKYCVDIRLVMAASKIGVLEGENTMASLAKDFSLNDNGFAQKYNQRYFKYIEKQAPKLLGSYYSSYRALNEEQKQAVLSDEESSLVISSAGSGKTRVIVNKYEYLTTVKGVDKNAIRILAYTKATRKEINQEKLGLHPDKGPARTFHSFANEIIELSGTHPQYLKDVQEAANGSDIDHSPRAAVLFKVMTDDGIEQDNSFMNALSRYAVSYKSKDKNQNLSFYTDRNGKIGSLKSYQEKVIFDFLADNSVDFAYEEQSADGKAHPDFTLYFDGQSVYYEHFAIDAKMSFSPYGVKYLEDAKRKIDQWGDNLIYTTGADISDTDEIIEQLKGKLSDLGIPLNRIRPEVRTAILKKKETYQEIFQSGIKMCLDVYDIIRETRIPMAEAYARCHTNEYANAFITVLFDTVKKYYGELLTPSNKSGEKRIDYTGCIEYASELCRNRKISSIPWDYILIDEYQDISPLRYEFLKNLRLVNPKLRICAVGDDWQSIYSFANSDLSRFIGFEKDWPYSRALKMTQTFRFNDPLLSVSSTFLRNGRDPLLVDKDVVASEHAPQMTRIEVKECNDFFHQINLIKKIIRDKDLEPKDCLILARYKYDLKIIKNSFCRDNLLLSFRESDCFMTMHASKGLTRDYVFLVNCNADVIPSQVEDDIVIQLIRSSNHQAKINEERRLFYVAITRASAKTYVLYSGTPSVFVNELIDIGQ